MIYSRGSMTLGLLPMASLIIGCRAYPSSDHYHSSPRDAPTFAWQDVKVKNNPAGVVLGAAMQAVANMHDKQNNNVGSKWISQNLIKSISDDQGVVRVFKRDTWEAGEYTVKKSDIHKWGFSNDGQIWPDVVAHGLKAAGWGWDENLDQPAQMGPTDALVALIGPGKTDTYANHTLFDEVIIPRPELFIPGPWILQNQTIPITLYTKGEGTVNLKPNYAYAVLNMSMDNNEIWVTDPAQDRGNGLQRLDYSRGSQDRKDLSNIYMLNYTISI